jgi:3' exoribonuclease, RNase T-like
MRAWFDTEFAQIPGKGTQLVSIGIVREDGQEFHGVRDIDTSEAGWWFRKHVWRGIKDDPKMSEVDLAAAVYDALWGVTEVATREGGDDFDLLEDLIGPLTRKIDINKLWESVGQPKLPKLNRKRVHHALEDAKFYRHLHELLGNYEQPTPQTC